MKLPVISQDELREWVHAQPWYRKQENENRDHRLVHSRDTSSGERRANAGLNIPATPPENPLS